MPRAYTLLLPNGTCNFLFYMMYPLIGAPPVSAFPLRLATFRTTAQPICVVARCLAARRGSVSQFTLAATADSLWAEVEPI